MSDDFDEIDWEMSGKNFNLKQYPNGAVQNNYFAKGIVGSYDRGQFIECANPGRQFHTYSFDWTPEKLDWLIDGKIVRTFLAKNADNNEHQFPQTPSKIQLGIWNGGDPDQHPGTIGWAGGLTDMTKVPYYTFVKSVNITNYNPAQQYKWTDQSGSWKSIKPINDTAPSSSNTGIKSAASSIPSSVTTRTSMSMSTPNTPSTLRVSSSPSSSGSSGSSGSPSSRGTPSSPSSPSTSKVVSTSAISENGSSERSYVSDITGIGQDRQCYTNSKSLYSCLPDFYNSAESFDNDVAVA
ncbi:hypothetical protein JX266_008346 [Neoarthrinium moseri]|nr:hypothetical protein JX266_008346 [Neoarthrinium moseri]